MGSPRFMDGHRVYPLVRRLVLPSITAISLLALTALSLVGLNLLGNLTVVDWDRLGEIGSAFGAPTAVLTTFALLGVVLALRMQWQELRIARAQSVRESHLAIMAMAINDPTLICAFGPKLQARIPSLESAKVHLYLNLLANHSLMAHKLGEFSESHVRVLAREIFAGDEGLRYWENAAPAWDAMSLVDVETRRWREIMTSEYQAACAQQARAGRAGDSPGSE